MEILIILSVWLYTLSLPKHTLTLFLYCQLRITIVKEGKQIISQSSVMYIFKDRIYFIFGDFH